MPYLSEVERGRKEPSSEILGAVTGALGLRLVDLTEPQHLGLVYFWIKQERDYARAQTSQDPDKWRRRLP